MSIDTNTYPATTFAFYIASEATLGTINTTASDYIQFDVNSINDVDWAGGLISDDTLKSGQRYKRDTDIFRTTSGSAWTWDFEYLASDQNAVNLLLESISETTASPYSSSANSEPFNYTNGETTGKKVSILIRSPRTGDDRAITGAVLTTLTVSGDAGSDGGRLKLSGQFMTGIKPTVATNATITSIEGGAATKTRVAWEKTVFDLTTKQLGGNDIVLEKFEATFNFPSVRLGWDAVGEAQVYGRGGPATSTGNLTVKYDDNSAAALASFEAGSPLSLTLSGSNGFGIKFPGGIVPSGYTPDFAREEAAFVEIPFEAVGSGSQNVYVIDVS